MTDATLHFDISTGLKRVLGRELITDDEVALFELVKNSFDAGADQVHLHFSDDSIVIADNGSGMSYDDLIEKWLFVAYSSKRDSTAVDFRDRVANRAHYAGSKGIGRFSSDRLGEEVVLQTRPKIPKSGPVHKLIIDWSRFEEDDKEHFEDVPVTYVECAEFELPDEMATFARTLRHGTIVEIKHLRLLWGRDELKQLKASLAKLINPFGSDVDRFSIFISAPSAEAEDEQVRKRASAADEEPVSRDIINGRVGNFIFSALQERTTFIDVRIEDEHIETSLTDRGELVYKIKEPNPYRQLASSGFHCEIYYLNHSAKVTFARRVGLPSVQFGSVFLFRNGFRVYPIGEDGDDWFGFARRKQQGHSRFLGTREVIGRVDVYGTDDHFQESSSRNQGLIDTPAVRQLQKCVMEHCLKRLERYVVPVSWVDKADADAEDLSRLLTDPGRARVSAAVAGLVDNDEVQLVAYSKRLIGLLNERSNEFEGSLVSLRAIALKTGDNKLLEKLTVAERRFDELRKSEAEARKIADREREAALQANERAVAAELEAERTQQEIEVERRRSHFLETVVDLDVSTILNLHHQVTIYSVDINQQIENLITDTHGKRSVPREMLLPALEQMAFLNRKIQAITRFATKANFRLDSEKITTDLPLFIEQYISHIAKGGARIKVLVRNTHPGCELRFNPIDVSIIVDNLVSNARRAKASQVTFDIQPLERSGILLRVNDNGRGIANSADPERIFEMGYTTTQGSGLGLYHVRQVLGQMNGSIEIEEIAKGKGATFVIKISTGRKPK